MATLGYWNFRGLGQIIRYLLAYLEVKYTHTTYGNFQEWVEQKNTLGLEFPNLPYYMDDYIKLTESSAIAVYLIKKNNQHQLLGQNADGSYDEKEVRVQQLIGVIRDLVKEITLLCLNKEFETVKDKVFTEKLYPILTKLIKYLGDKDFLIGCLSLADFFFYEILNYFKYIYPQTITKTISDYLIRFENIPSIKKYLDHPNVDMKIFTHPQKFVWTGPK